MANDLVIKIKADSSGVKPAIDGAEKSVVDLGQKGRKSSSDIAEGFAQVIAAIGRVDSSLTAMTGHINAGFGGVSTAMASARTQTVAVESAVEREKRAVDGADRSLNKLGADGAKAGKQVAAGMDGAAKSADMLGIVAKGVIGYFSVSAVAGFARDVMDAGLAADSLHRTFQAITGSSSGATKELEFLRKEADRTGQNFYALAPAVKGVFAAAKGTVSEGAVVRDVISGIAEASTALSLKSVETERALAQLTQMISKNKVELEDLKVFAESFPGAMELFARAFGKPLHVMLEMMSKGEVLINDVLPGLAREMHNAHAVAAETSALEGGQAAVNRLSQEWTDFKTNLFDTDAFVAATNGVKDLIASMNSYWDAGKKGSEQSLRLSLSSGQSQLDAMKADRGWIASAGLTEAEGNRKIAEMESRVEALKQRINPQADGWMQMQDGLRGVTVRMGELANKTAAANDELAKLTQTPRQKINAKADELLGKGADPAMVEDYRRKEISKIAEQEASKTKRGSAGPSLDMDGYGKDAMAKIQAESQRKMDLLRASLASEMAVAQRGYDAGTTSLEAYYAERRRVIETESQAEIQQQQQTITQAQAEIARLQQLKPQGARGAEQISDQTRALDEKIKDAQAKIDVLKVQTTSAVADISADQATAARERITQAMSDAQAVITATEQSLQSRVVTGLETEATARAKLKDTIREQGAALEQDLVPQIERMMLVAGNPKARAELQAMLDKIREMAAEAKTQTWTDGMIQGVQDYATEASDAFQTAKDAATQAFSSMEDALVEFTTTGKLSVSDMVQSMLADIARLAIRQSITQPLASGLTSVIGSLLGGGSSWAGVNTSWSGAATTNAAISGNSGFGLATGGRITGPGTGTSDDVPMWGSNGEFVIREASARKLGYAQLEWINANGELPERHATGGIIGQRKNSLIERTVDRSTLERVIGGNTVERLMQSDRTVDRSTLERALPSIHAHANTVRDTPTPFAFSGLQAFAKGGIFAEAGPEAVMPLTRTSDGRLGVASTGGATQPQTMNVRLEVANSGAAKQVESVTPRMDVEGMVLKVMMKDLAMNGTFTKAYAASHNLKRTV